MTRAQPRTRRRDSPGQCPVAFLIKEGEAYQLLTLVNAHEPAQVVENLYPALGDILSRNVITDFKLHERLAQQYRRAQATLCRFDVARSSDQRFKEGIENTLENF